MIAYLFTDRALGAGDGHFVSLTAIEIVTSRGQCCPRLPPVSLVCQGLIETAVVSSSSVKIARTWV
jgi:hypothetical protein